MRTIKFRGRVPMSDKVYGGKVVYGCVVIYKSGLYTHWIYPNEGECNYPVEPESVAQYIATDVNGKEIYEGDPISNTFDWGWDKPEQFDLFEQRTVVLNNKFHHKATFADYEDILEGCAALVDPAIQENAINFWKSETLKP